jgi:hypothetical protein
VGVNPACARVGVGMAGCGEEVWQSRQQIGPEGVASAGAVERRRSGLQLQTPGAAACGVPTVLLLGILPRGGAVVGGDLDHGGR